MRRAIGLLSLALVALLAAAPASHAQAPKEVVIGVIYPMTGQLAQLGIDSVTAIKMSTELYNGKSDLNLPSMKQGTEGLPGLGGAKIRLIIVDPQGKPDVGQSEAEHASQSIDVLEGRALGLRQDGDLHLGRAQVIGDHETGHQRSPPLGPLPSVRSRVGE